MATRNTGPTLNDKKTRVRRGSDPLPARVQQAEKMKQTGMIQRDIPAISPLDRVGEDYVYSKPWDTGNILASGAPTLFPTETATTDYQRQWVTENLGRNGIPLGVPPPPVFNVATQSGEAAQGAVALRPKSGGSGAPDDGSTLESNAARSKAQYTRNQFLDDTAPKPNTQVPGSAAPPYSGPPKSPTPSGPSSQPSSAPSVDPLKQLNMAYKVAQDPLMSWEARSAAHRVITEHFESQAALARAARHQADFDAAMQIRATETARKAKVQGDWDQASSNARKAAASAPQGPPDYEAQDARSRALLDPANIANARSQTDWNALQGVDQSRVQSFQHEQDMSRQMRGMGLDPSGDEAARLRFLAGDRMPDSVFSAHPQSFGPSGPQTPQQYHNTFNLREGRPMELDPSFLAQQEAQNFAWQARGAQIEDKANQASQDSYFLRQKRDQAGSQLNPWSAMGGAFSY